MNWRRTKLKDMSLDLELSKLDLNNLHDINVALCNDITSNAEKVAEITETEERDRSRFPVLKAELDDLRSEVAELELRLRDATSQVSAADEDLLMKQAEERALQSKLKNLTLELDRLQGEQKGVKEQLREARREVGKLQRLLTSSTERPHTPRVDWKALRERHGIELNIEQPSTLVVSDLVAYMHDKNTELEAVRDQLPWVQAEKKQRQMMAGKWFVCRGTAPAVPKFLRMQGKVRNRNMQKRDCELLIKEFWAARQKQNTSRTGSTLRPLPPFLIGFGHNC